MKLKKIIRLLALIFAIAMASVLPVPITFYKKHESPPFLIERVDKEKEEEDDSEIKALF